MKKNLIRLAFVVMAACPVWAGSVCPAGSGANPFPHNPDNANTGCNVLITINANGSTTVTVQDTTPYEASEDVLVGIKNNSSSTVPNISLSGSGIFGVDGDGICVYTFVGSGYCNTSQMNGTDPQDYYGPITTYSFSNPNSGTVNFTTPLGPGASTYFSLEGIPSSTLAVSVGSGTAVAGAPALSVWAMAILASLLVGCSLWMLRRPQQQQD